MYNDLRAASHAPQVADALRDSLAPYGIQIAPAFALPKVVHLMRNDPQLQRRCRHLIHQTDWLTGMLCGEFGVTDVSTALKTGVDPGTLQWPRPIEESLGIPPAILPRVVLPGTKIGEVTLPAAADTGLDAGTPVVAGCTDGTAGFLASGATESGDLSVTLGTTLVLKAIAPSPLIDPEGVLYNHRHPSGGYLPGAASNTGAEWVDRYFPNADLRALGHEAARRLPTRRKVYPLVKTGERFPFACPTATGFGLDEIEHAAERYAAGMEGVAFLERMGIERLEGLGLEIGPTVRATGGGAAGEAWLAIRAAVNQRVYCVPQYPDCAVGAAVLAASEHRGGCRQATAAMVRSGRAIEPDAVLVRQYAQLYEPFQDALRQRGYL
jgi:xylulokinase